MDRELEELVRQRAGLRCEYCRLPASLTWLRFQIDHVIAQKHGGQTTADNLALSCYLCNSYKGPNISGIDPVSGRMVRLYHPRRDLWPDHFQYDDALLLGRTAVGRATIQVLWMNHPTTVELRESLIAEGGFLP